MRRTKRKQAYYQYNFEDIYGREWRVSPKIKKEQLTFEDVYDTSILGEVSEEEVIRANTIGLKKCRYCVRTIVSGDYVESDIYPVWGKHDVPRAIKSRESRKEQKNLNCTNAQKEVVRKIQANFEKGDLLITLTYKDFYYPTEERARKDIDNYVTKLKRVRKKLGMSPLKYLWVIEYVPEEEDTKKVRIHHHLIINRMDRDLAESKWKMGRCETKYADPDEDFHLKGYAKYISKGIGKGHHKWGCSRNLKKSQVYTSTTKMSKRKMYDLVRSGDDISKVFESVYKGNFKYTGSKIYWSDYVGGFYIYGTMKKKKEVEIVGSKESTLTGTDSEKEKIAPVQRPKVRVFVDMDWKGNLSNGEACFSALFQMGHTGEPQYFLARIQKTTKNRAMLHIGSLVMSKFTMASDIELHAPGNILSTGINLNRFRQQQRKEYKDVKNADLIEKLLGNMDKFNHKIRVISEKSNEYSAAMEIERKNNYNTIPVIIDQREEQ